MSKISRILSAFLCAAILIGGVQMWFSVKAESDKVTVWTENWRNQIFKDDTMQENSASVLSLDTAKNEYEPGQIVIRSEEELTIKSVVFEDLCSGSGLLSSTNATYNFVGYYKVVNNTKDLNNPVRKAPGDFPERLDNMRSITVPANTTQPIWVKYYIPKDTAAGEYSGKITLQTTKGNFSVPVTVRVKNITLPDSEEGVFNMEFWNYLTIAHKGDNFDSINHTYGIKQYSDEWRTLMDRFAAYMKEYRLNTFFVRPIDLLADAPGTSIDASGKITFDWSLFDRFVKLFIEKGGISKLTASPLGFPIAYSNGTTGYRIMTLNKSGPSFVKGYREINNGGEAFLNQYLPELNRHLTESGWFNIWYQHIGDEPFTTRMRNDYIKISDILEKHCPNIKKGDASYMKDAEEFGDAMNLWIPNTEVYDTMQNFYNEKIANGEEVWMYTANWPQGDYMNRGIDTQLYKSELLGWMAYKAGITGYMHWGLMAWDFYEPVDFDEAKTEANLKHPGDCYSIYPDKENLDIISSIRMEAMREASETYELLALYAKKNATAAKNAAGSLVQSGTEYCNDIYEIAAKRAEILENAAEPEPTSQPAESSVSTLTTAKTSGQPTTAPTQFSSASATTQKQTASTVVQTSSTSTSTRSQATVPPIQTTSAHISTQIQTSSLTTVRSQTKTVPSMISTSQTKTMPDMGANVSSSKLTEGDNTTNFSKSIGETEGLPDDSNIQELASSVILNTADLTDKKNPNTGTDASVLFILLFMGVFAITLGGKNFKK